MLNKITTGLTSLVLLSAVFATPAFADTDVVIAGNGSHSDNDVRVDLERNTTVSQTNDTDISNNVSVNNNTGYNSASGNTGGDVSIRTGDATSDVNISNQAGVNIANINGCCDNGDTTLRILGNGYRSDNSINFSQENNLRLIQNNDTDITNDVDVHNNTGHNSADGNTWGDVSIDTGDADSNVYIHNEAGKNVANIDGCCDEGDTTIKIEGNGSKSDNSVWFNSDNDRNFYQNNDTDFDNDVDVHNNTGYNHASSDYNFPWWYDFDHGKKYKDYDHNKKDHDKNYPYVKFYDKDYDHDKKDYDHDKKYFNHKKVDYDRCDYDHWKDYKWNDWKWYKDNCEHEKKYVHPVKYFNYDKHKKYDYGKNRHDDNKYVFVKYPYDKYDHNNYCDSSRDYNKYDYPWMNYHPYHGNTGGDVTIRTGDANSDVNLHNLGSSNYLNI
jgi:spore coat protein C